LCSTRGRRVEFVEDSANLRRAGADAVDGDVRNTVVQEENWYMLVTVAGGEATGVVNIDTVAQILRPYERAYSDFMYSVICKSQNYRFATTRKRHSATRSKVIRNILVYIYLPIAKAWI
jgi:hypothetical protein